MLLKEFVDNLNKLMEERPETADFDVVTATDGEGNSFELVYYTPSVGNYDAVEKDFGHNDEEVELNAVCVN